MKSKSIIPVFFILILSLFPTLPFVESAGYGEENENLGQFTDDFENPDNVSVAVNVINNQTLDCMELNISAGGNKLYENFNDYTQIEPDDRVDIVNDTHVAHNSFRDEDSYLYYDYGTDYFDDFTHQFIFESDYHEANALGYVYMVSDYVDDALGIINANKNYLGLRIQHTGGQFRVYLIEVHNGDVYNDMYPTLLSNTLYYVNVSKYDTDLDIYIYDDPGMTNLIDQLSLTLHTDHKLEYIFACNSYNSGAANININNDIYFLWIGRYSEGYETEGYFITEDYLNYTTGNGLALLTNASIPVGTSMTVQFSNDNATWVDNEGNVGSTPVLDGFYAIDMRDLNYTDSFKRYNLTTTNTLITPRLFQSRLVTTNGTGGAAGPGAIIIVTEESFFWVFIAIALSMIVGIIVWLKYGNQ